MNNTKFLYDNDNLFNLKQDIDLLENIYHFLSNNKINNDIFKDNLVLTNIIKSDINWDKINLYRKSLHRNLICLQKQKDNVVTLGYYSNNKSLCYTSLFCKEYRDGLEVQNLCLSPMLFFLSFTKKIKNYKMILLKQVTKLAKDKNKNYLYIIDTEKFHENVRIESIYKRMMINTQVKFLYEIKHTIRTESYLDLSYIIQDISLLEDLVKKKINPLNLLILFNTLNELYEKVHVNNIINIIYNFIKYTSNNNNKTTKIIKELECHIVDLKKLIKYIVSGNKIIVFYCNSVLLGYLCFDIKNNVLNVNKILESSWLFILNLIKSQCHHDLYKLAVDKIMKIAIQGDITLRIRFNIKD